MMLVFNSITALFIREFQITYRNFSDILSILLFFLLGIIIFIFAIGPNKEIFNQINVSIIWALILLSNTLSIRKYFQNDFDDNSIILFHVSGLSLEIIVIIKIISIWIFIQIPFIIIIPLSYILLNLDFNNIKIFYISFLIGSSIISCITSISSSMNLLNKNNFAIGSLIIMILSIPVIIFSVNLNYISEEIVEAQIKILIGIMLLFFAITPWVSALCIKLGLQNK
jgi:heme exporter protein B